MSSCSFLDFISLWFSSSAGDGNVTNMCKCKMDPVSQHICTLADLGWMPGAHQASLSLPFPVGHERGKKDGKQLVGWDKAVY